MMVRYCILEGRIAFQNVTIKESVNFCLLLRFWTTFTTNKKAHGYTASISAFYRSEVEIVQISAILEKQKRFISICYLISCISLFSFLFGLMKAKIGKNINKKEKNVILYG